jgi:hypothetical protein
MAVVVGTLGREVAIGGSSPSAIATSARQAGVIMPQ